MKPQNLISKINDFKKKGIIKDVKEAIQFTDEPKFPQWFCIPAEGREPLEEQYGGSLSLTDNLAKTRAIGEAIERYCSEQISKEKVECSYIEIKQYAVDPALFINYSNKVLFGKKEDYINKIRREKLSWVLGTHMNSGKEFFLPAQLVYSPYDISNEPLIRTPISTGAATALSKEKAIERGLFEIVERDSFMLYWLSKKKPSVVNLNSSNKLKELRDYFNRYLLDLQVYDITTDLEIPSIFSMLLDKTDVGPVVSVGLKSGKDPLNTIIGSILEAQQVRGWIRFSYFRDNFPQINLKKQIVDLKTRGYFWYDSKRKKDLEFIIGGKSKNLIDVGLFRYNIHRYLIKKNFDIFHVDLTIDSLRDEGIFVVKTIVPQMHPLSLDEDMPYDYSERLISFHNKEINNIPHPFL